MNGKYLFDTNIVIAFLSDDVAVIPHIGRSDEYYISSIVIGELYYGALHSASVDQNVGRISEFVRDAVAVPCDHATARIYGDIKTSLRLKGRPIPDNDIWIAATVIQHSLTLVVRDEHFNNISDLPVVRW
jgi:tRNA(fMet)-specific endonuclease VapC